MSDFVVTYRFIRRLRRGELWLVDGCLVTLVKKGPWIRFWLDHPGSPGTKYLATREGALWRKLDNHQKGVIMGDFVQLWRERNLVRSNGHVPQDNEFSTKFPAIWDFMTSTTWDGGKPRCTSTMFIFVENSYWKVCFNDRDRQEVGFVSGETFFELLRSLEERLQNGSLDWREQRSKEAKKK